MKIWFCIMIALLASNDGFADELVADENCALKIVEAKNYIQKNKTFLFGIKNSSKDFISELSEFNASLKKTSNYMIECMALHHVQNTRAAFETPYYPIMNLLEKIHARLHYIQRNPDSAKKLIDNLFRENLKNLESALSQGVNDKTNKSLTPDVASGAG